MLLLCLLNTVVGHKMSEVCVILLTGIVSVVQHVWTCVSSRSVCTLWPWSLCYTTTIDHCPCCHFKFLRSLEFSWFNILEEIPYVILRFFQLLVRGNQTGSSAHMVRNHCSSTAKLTFFACTKGVICTTTKYFDRRYILLTVILNLNLIGEGD